MSTETREWPNNWLHLRDRLAEVERKNYNLLMALKITHMCPEDERIVDRLMKRTMISLRALERAGAQTDPLSELEDIAENEEVFEEDKYFSLPKAERFQQVPA